MSSKPGAPEPAPELNPGPNPESNPESNPEPNPEPSLERPGEWMTIDGTAYRCVVLCFLFRSRRRVDEEPERSVLLGLKRTGFGTGRVVALGGKIDGRESAVEAAVREVAEESGIELVPDALHHAGRVSWSFPDQPSWNMTAFLFTADAGSADPTASEEIEPHWYGVGAIPWDAMWRDAPYWLPTLLDGRPVDAHIEMERDNEGVASAVLR
ncbi:NUDIX domain-containing protein [Arthrobacter sp. NamB2]|uniref:8-oxo-dGTP diphosphatase n=1 Tax=Arthrobacter sp. NamB2 TaxID=2576035 RepID=UPI0010C9C852|nr:NUDIX domain-containing protein [Arthrobacter sp. NamB2]TKV28266.1 NUDIX domain-containing protein [Arthrobacter sp. NamB2]